MPDSQQHSPALQKINSFFSRVKDRFHNTHKTANTWLLSKSMKVEDFRKASQQLLAATSLAGQVVLTSPAGPHVVHAFNNTKDASQKLVAEVTQEEQEAVLTKLKQAVQMPPGHLATEDEQYLEQQLSSMLGFEVTAELDGHRLNHSIGIMGGEQHLKRYPTDTLANHDAYQESGMAPARGAFGWFTENGELTEEAIQREKYYFAVQTLYLPDWNSNHKELKPWYKFRKMVAINPAEEIAVVAVVGDAGPAQWVKKQYGGSPEVIREGKIWSPKSRGRVLLFFVDDPEDKIPLGPMPLRSLPTQVAQGYNGGTQ